MAQFRAVIKGQRGMASRLGNKKSGLTANVDGWHKGIRVEANHEDGRDTFKVYSTGGSYGSNSKLVYSSDLDLAEVL